MSKARTVAAAAAVAVAGYSCGAFVSGDSTIYQAQTAANIDGNATPGCGWSDTQGWVDRLGFGIAESCITNYLDGLPAPGTVIVAGVSIHDVWSDAPTADGPWSDPAPRVDGYVQAHDQLEQLGYSVAWVEAPPAEVGPWVDLNDELADLNAQIAAALDCALVPASVRVDDRYDGIHYTPEAAARVGTRLSVLDEGDVC